MQPKCALNRSSNATALMSYRACTASCTAQDQMQAVQCSREGREGAWGHAGNHRSSAGGGTPRGSSGSSRDRPYRGHVRLAVRHPAGAVGLYRRTARTCTARSTDVIGVIVAVRAAPCGGVPL